MLGTYFRFLAGKWKIQDGSKWKEIEVELRRHSFLLFPLIQNYLEFEKKTTVHCLDCRRCQDFAITQILCEINFGDYGSAKPAVFLPF